MLHRIAAYVRECFGSFESAAMNMTTREWTIAFAMLAVVAALLLKIGTRSRG